ncbi:Transporter of the ATP-binding cassette (ABC) [Batrachochytrium dendrobatidis]|nr:Transporter of the ATP-binding cassette (ABC) [Batrachochytrium dendrobatidis]
MSVFDLTHQWLVFVISPYGQQLLLDGVVPCFIAVLVLLNTFWIQIYEHVGYQRLPDCADESTAAASSPTSSPTTQDQHMEYAVKFQYSIDKSVKRTVLFKVILTLLMLAQIVLSALICNNQYTISMSYKQVFELFPGHALLLITWTLGLIILIIGLAIDYETPALTTASQSYAGPIFHGLLWLGFARLISIPADIRSLWIVCETAPIGEPYCSNNNIAAMATRYLFVLGIYSCLKLLSNEHRFRVWLLSNDKSVKESCASIWSIITFSWMDDLISLGYDKSLDSEDLNNMMPDDLAKNIRSSYEACQNENCSLIWNLTTYVGTLLIIQAIFAFFSAVFTLGSPYFLQQILIFVENPASISHPSVAVMYAFAIFLSSISRSICDGQMYLIGRRIGLRVRSVIVMLIYEKSLIPASHLDTVLDLSLADSNASSGKIVNLMSSDAFKVLDFASYVMYLWMTPLEALICIIFLVYIAGPAGLAGVAMMVIMIPIGGQIGHLIARYQKQLMEATDGRINAINELLHGIRIVKFFAWEPRFAKKIRDLRENELKALWSYIFTTALSRVIWAATPVLVSFCTFTMMTWVFGQNLDASTAFTALALLNLLRMPLQAFPDAIVKLMESLVSIRRIEDYLEEPNIHNSVDSSAVFTDSVQFIGNATFSWYATRDNNSRPASHLKNLTLGFPKNKLSVVYGPTGGGKSSLLMAILGEMHLKHGGGVHLGELQKGDQHLPIAFASQQSWLQNATIRENICFGSAFDPVRYQETLAACALTKDLENLDGGDMTEVGEKGVNLSGGQKARISLARAVYSRSPLVLIDDPLSAVDAPTARHLFEKCICGPLLAGRTRILVTHAKALCAPKADFVVRLSKGVVLHSAESPVRHAIPDALLDADLTPDDTPMAGASSKSDASTLIKGKGTSSKDLIISLEENSISTLNIKRITIEEKRLTGSVPFRVYMAYMLAAGGFFFLVAVLAAYTSAQGLVIGNDIWLKTWADAYRQVPSVSNVGNVFTSIMQPFNSRQVHETRQLDLVLPTTGFLIQNNDLFQEQIWAAGNSSTTVLMAPKKEVNLSYYIGIYAFLGSLSIFAVFIRVCVVAIGSLNASRTIHNNLVDKILRAPAHFFEKTPMGRILNRFSKDIKDIDQEVGIFIGDFLGNCISATGILCLILYATPQAIFSVIPISVIYVVVGRSYIRSSRELKRLDSITRSPIFSHFGETINGASTIRAYSAQNRFVDQIHKRIDHNNIAFFNLWALNRWLGIRVDFSGALISLASAMAIVTMVLFNGGMNAGLAGLSISYSLSFSQSLLWLIRMHALMEMEINAVERVDEYLQIKEEAPATIPATCPVADWPTHGNISVENLTLRYSSNLNPVLSNVTFQCRAGEKVAVVGRTGAGKTTLSLAFFRFLEFEAGHILIDGVDISTIGVHDLRSRLTIIPQDPVLFSGTLRSNLDPFNQHTDAEIWSCLRLSHFLDSIRQSALSPNSSSGSLLKGVVESELLSSTSLPLSDTTQNLAIPSTSLISIDTPVNEGGTNFSQGQRQLLCLSRALLRRSRVILLDEATASVDHDTDLRIQLSIRSEFRNATLLCIAHRLRTIIDYDKVLVLDKGKVAQFGTPNELLSMGKGIFYDMCAETGELDELKESAKRHVKL